jgi:copper chaperone CopZ
VKPITTPWYDYSYLPCQSCVGKNHCAQCGEEIRQALLAMAGVADAEMDVPARRLRMALAGVEADDIIDQADAIGVFL